MEYGMYEYSCLLGSNKLIDYNLTFLKGSEVYSFKT